MTNSAKDDEISPSIIFVFVTLLNDLLFPFLAVVGSFETIVSEVEGLGHDDSLSRLIVEFFGDCANSHTINRNKR